MSQPASAGTAPEPAPLPRACGEAAGPERAREPDGARWAERVAGHPSGAGHEHGNSTRVVVGQWNLAGINNNAFEFSQCTPPADAGAEVRAAVSFASRLSAAVEELMGDRPSSGLGSGPRAPPALSELTLAQVLAPLGDFAGSSPVAARVLEAAPQTTVQEFLRDAEKGNRALSSAQKAFTEAGWSLMRLTSESAVQFMRVYHQGDEAAFWARWLASAGQSYPEARENASELMLLAVFEVVLFHLAVCILREDSGAQYGEANWFSAAIATFVDSMCVENHAKASGVARVIGGAHARCLPDALCLQEFNQQWQKDPAFAQFWEKLLLDYEVFCPRSVLRPHMAVQLLVRRAGALAADAQATSMASQAATSAAFLDSLLPRYIELFGEAMGIVMHDRIACGESPLATRLALAVCHDVSAGGPAHRRPFLVASAHAASDGTDNRAIVIAARHLAESQACELILGMDANSAADFPLESVERGASRQRDFLEFLAAQGVRHCFAHWGPDAAADFTRFHTVSKTRSYLQCQLHKAGKSDVSAKDFVLFVGQGLQQLEGRRLNTTSWLSRPIEPAHANASRLPDEKDTWVNDTTMPTPDFVSDHSLVIAEARL